MPIHLSWYDDNRTIAHAQFEHRWTWAEFYELHKRSDALLDTVNYKVYFMISFHKSSFVPRDFVLKQVVTVLESSHPNCGPYIIVGLNHYLRLILDNILKMNLLHSQLHLAKTMEEGFALATTLTEQTSPPTSNDT